MNKLILRPFLHDSQRVTIQVRQPGKTTQVSTEPAPDQSKHASPTVITFITINQPASLIFSISYDP